MNQLLSIIIFSFLVFGCAEYELRGKVTQSEDGKTYLVVLDDNGGKCGPITLNGVLWPYPLGVAGKVKPGGKILKCGATIGFDVRKGTTFHVTYWGP